MATEKRHDLIDRNELLAEYDRVHIGEPGKARKLMEDAPTVDAVEVVHGRWHYCGEECYVCSVCHNNFMIDYNYCPECGTNMDEERRSDNG